MKIQAALVAPALQLDHPITLPHRMPFRQRQAAGLREQFGQQHRLMIHFETVSACDLPERFVADIGPGGLQRKIVIDLTRHAGSGYRIGIIDGHPNRAANTAQDQSSNRISRYWSAILTEPTTLARAGRTNIRAGRDCATSRLPMTRQAIAL